MEKEQTPIQANDGKDNRAERIAQKGARIAEKGERIAKKNAEAYGFPMHSPEKPDEEELNGDTAPSSDDTSTQVPQEASEPVRYHEPEAAGKKQKNKKGTCALILSIVATLLTLTTLVCSVMGIFPLFDGAGGVVNLLVSGGGSGEDVSGDTSSDMLEDVINSVVLVKTTTASGTGIGTGIILSADGYIATNYHVVDQAKSITVTTYDSQALQAELVGYSEVDDLAVLKVKADSLRPATFAKSSECRIGESVFAIGFPEGDEYGWSVTKGIVSCPDREIKIYDSEGILEKKMYVIQTDTPVNPGNSGGPLINSRGEVLGIITLKLANSAGMGFAIPSDGALELITAIIETGSADSVNSSVTKGRPLIGITGVGVEANKWYESYTDGAKSGIREVDEEYAKANPDTAFYAAIKGVHVSIVNSKMDAANKIKVGDILTKVDGVEVTNIYQVMDLVNKHNGGDEIEIVFYRDGKYHTINVILGTDTGD